MFEQCYLCLYCCFSKALIKQQGLDGDDWEGLWVCGTDARQEGKWECLGKDLPSTLRWKDGEF